MTTNLPDAETISTQNMASDELVNKLVEQTTNNDYVDVIQAVIGSLDHEQSAMVSQNEQGYIWKFKYNTVEVFVQLTGMTDNDTFTIWSAVLQLPAKNEAQLMRKLLEMNWAETYESRFGIFNDQIVVVSTRNLAELSPSEISRSITIVATIADNNNESLQAEFGAA